MSHLGAQARNRSFAVPLTLDMLCRGTVQPWGAPHRSCPARRGAGLPEVRLRGSAEAGDAVPPGRAPRHHHLPAAGGPRHWPGQQDRSVCIAGAPHLGMTQ